MGALDPLQNVVGLGGPDDGIGDFTIMVEAIEDHRGQLLGAGEDSAEQAVFRHATKDPFDLTQPRATGA